MSRGASAGAELALSSPSALEPARDKYLLAKRVLSEAIVILPHHLGRLFFAWIGRKELFYVVQVEPAQHARDAAATPSRPSPTAHRPRARHLLAPSSAVGALRARAGAALIPQEGEQRPRLQRAHPRDRQVLHDPLLHPTLARMRVDDRRGRLAFLKPKGGAAALLARPVRVRDGQPLPRREPHQQGRAMCVLPLQHAPAARSRRVDLPGRKSCISPRFGI